MNSSRPYLTRAIYEWVVDNGFTPQLLVDATLEDVSVPQQFVQDGRIVLNISANAVRNLVLGNEMVTFDARFSGTPYSITVPSRAVLAIYAAENGVGMAFKDEKPHAPDDGPTDVAADSTPRKSLPPTLKVVK